MDKPDLDIFEKKDLIRACKLVGYKNWIISLEDEDPNQLKKRIYSNVNPDNKPWRKQYEEACDFFELYPTKVIDDEGLREKLYNYNKKILEERISKMSDKKKKKLTKQLEEELEPETLEILQQKSRKAAMGGGGVLALQGGAIALTGSNLGICMLLTSGLSSVSSIIGVTFPFAAYTGAAVVGGKILAVAGFLTNPFVAIPILGASLYYAYTKKRNQQYINLAGITYLIESKKRLLGMK